MTKILAVIATTALLLLASSVLASTLPVHAQSPDFGIGVKPFSHCMNLGETALYQYSWEA